MFLEENLRIGNENFSICLGCVPLQDPDQGVWSGIQDHSDHGASKELMNLLWTGNRCLLWWSMMWVILDHGTCKSWFRSFQRNALRPTSFFKAPLKKNFHISLTWQKCQENVFSFLKKILSGKCLLWSSKYKKLLSLFALILCL